MMSQGLNGGCCCRAEHTSLTLSRRTSAASDGRQMKKEIVPLVPLAIVMLRLIVPSICLAQGSDEASQLRTLLHKGEVQVEKWEKTASTIIALTVLVGVLGIVAGALQKSSSNWCKIATVIVGLCISALTLVLN